MSTDPVFGTECPGASYVARTHIGHLQLCTHPLEVSNLPTRTNSVTAIGFAAMWELLNTSIMGFIVHPGTDAEGRPKLVVSNFNPTPNVIASDSYDLIGCLASPQQRYAIER